METETSLIVPYSSSFADRVAGLAVEDERREFIGGFPSALNEISDVLTGHVVLHNGEPAGFFLIDLDYANQYAFAETGSVGLRSFFIASRFQGKGLVKRALQELGPYLHAQGIDAGKIFLTVNRRNAPAASLYRKYGFRDDGELYLGGARGPQHIMQMSLA